jgi:hypothetical protein
MQGGSELTARNVTLLWAAAQLLNGGASFADLPIRGHDERGIVKS